jgi:tetratricopeptide (TPR) repeat protein
MSVIKGQAPKGSYSPALYEYLRKYQEDPTSRIFAPLSEAYRKAGMAREAVEIAREGLRIHPQFVGGRVALARALFDLKEYDDVMAELRAVVRDVPDNLVAQRLYADSALMLGLPEEALTSFKMLLYFSPLDTEVAELVHELETRMYEEGATRIRKDLMPGRRAPEAAHEFETRAVTDAFAGDRSGNRVRWKKQVELLQGLLQKVERYRHQS